MKAAAATASLLLALLELTSAFVILSGPIPDASDPGNGSFWTSPPSGQHPLHRVAIATSRSDGDEGTTAGSRRPGGNDEEHLVVREMNLKWKIKDKNGKDMFEVSKFLLDEGFRRSLLQAIKENLGIDDPKAMAGIDKSLVASFKKVQDEAVHVDLDKAKQGDGEMEKRISISFPALQPQRPEGMEQVQDGQL